eukprot:18115-Heterococcus_DN1.PRE.5
MQVYCTAHSDYSSSISSNSKSLSRAQLEQYTILSITEPAGCLNVHSISPAASILNKMCCAAQQHDTAIEIYT